MTPRLVWYHIMVSFYGTWLYGDRRGFRTRHHREHVEGDYKNPPAAGMYDHLERRSRKLLKQEPVSLDSDARGVVGMAVKERLTGLGALVICVAVSSEHLHVLAKMPFGTSRAWMGIAKRHAWFVMRDQGWSGKLWGKRCKAVPIKDRRHQLNVYHYILDHVNEGAWVWKWSKEA